MSVWKDKKRGWWVAKFNHNRKRYKKEGFKSQREAKEWERKEREIVQTEENQIPLTSFHEIATAYLEHCELRMQKNTCRQKAFVFRQVLAYLGSDIPIQLVTNATISNFLQSHAKFGKNYKSLNRYLRDIKALFNYAIKNEYYDGKNQANRVEKYPKDEYIPYVPTIDDIKKVKNVASEDEKDFIQTIFYTMARKNEIVVLKWEDVDFSKRTVTLFTRKRKDGARMADKIPMNDSLFQILNRRYSRQNGSSEFVFCFGKYQLRSMMNKLCSKAGVPNFGFHALRHCAASLTFSVGNIDLKTMQRSLRHQRLSTTEIYLHEVGAGVKEAFAALEKMAQ